jgi:SAM-dependent methyltransferase
MEPAAPTDYWNHNSAYHPLILAAARRHRGGRALDVGCGEGLLVQRLAPIMGEVVGIDKDRPALELARRRIDGRSNVELINASFPAEIGLGSFDLITFVATIHHLDHAAAMAGARELLRPGGELIIVGLAAETPVEQLLGAFRVPLVRLLGRINHEEPSIPVPVKDPELGAAEIRTLAARELPGSTMSYGLYYRYLLRWKKTR